jgi:hypothetical protein
MGDEHDAERYRQDSGECAAECGRSPDRKPA